MKKLFGDIPIFWINLCDSVQRREHMMTQLKDYPFHKRVEAIDGRSAEKFKNKYCIKYTETPISSGVRLTTAVVAVICSHLKAIKMGFDEGYEMICVVEDDVHFDLVELFPFTVADIVNKVPVDWEIIQLYYTQNLEKNIKSFSVNGLELLPRDINYSGTCYLINRKGMERVLNTVAKTDGLASFEILNPITDPEQTVFSFLNAYVINLPFCYYYDNVATFSNYTTSLTSFAEKKYCEKVQFDSKEILIKFYLNS